MTGVRKNALQVLVPKFGLEGLLSFAPERGAGTTVSSSTAEQPEYEPVSPAVRFEHREESGSVLVTAADGETRHEFRLFEQLHVRVAVTQPSLQRQRLAFRLVYPAIPGFSVPPAPPRSALSPRVPSPSVLPETKV